MSSKTMAPAMTYVAEERSSPPNVSLAWSRRWAKTTIKMRRTRANETCETLLLSAPGRRKARLDFF